MTGAKGTVIIVPPLPYSLSVESPFMLLATTLAYTGVPHGREKGASCSTAAGTVQEVAATIDASLPSQ